MSSPSHPPFCLEKHPGRSSLLQAYQQGTKFPIAIKPKSGQINTAISMTYCLTPPLSKPTPCHCMMLAKRPPYNLPHKRSALDRDGMVHSPDSSPPTYRNTLRRLCLPEGDRCQRRKKMVLHLCTYFQCFNYYTVLPIYSFIYLLMWHFLLY